MKMVIISLLNSGYDIWFVYSTLPEHILSIAG